MNPGGGTGRRAGAIGHPLPARTSDTSPRAVPRRLAHGRLHLLLTLDSLLVVLVSVNRRAHSTLAPVAENGFLRRVEAGNMLLGLCTVLLYYLVAAHLVRDSARRRRGAVFALGALFTTGVYVYGLSLGDHEITNYLHGRFCSRTLPAICRVVAFNDDVFSDLVFLAGFTLLNTMVMAVQFLFPTDRAPRPWDTVLLAVNALFIGAGITANLAFEKALFDPFVIGATAVLALILLRLAPRQPMLRYYAVAYTAGLVATVVVKAQ
ncbi:hypothetical protein [Streptomyces sp. NPDC001068]|uniref:hypothetical protein n=1 Tax=Streptomyces sp. NPDC001068 TaxID=3364544 RepID=UPI0036CD74F5